MSENNAVPFPSLPTTRCHECFDFGVVYEGDRVRQCLRRSSGLPHNEPDKAGATVARIVIRTQDRGVRIDRHTFSVARSIAAATVDQPMNGKKLIERHFDYTPSAPRKLAECIETLRKVWRLPVGSHRGEPKGYWIITTAEDFQAWVAEARSAPITQLATIHAIAKSNFPDLAGQLYLDFADDLEREQMEEAA